MDPTKILQYIQLVQMILQLWLQMQSTLKVAAVPKVTAEDPVAQMNAINAQLANLIG